MSLNSSVSAMLTAPYGLNREPGPKSWTGVQTQQVGNLNSRGRHPSMKDNTSLRARMGPGGNPGLCLRRGGSSLPGAFRWVPQTARGQTQHRPQNGAWSSACTPTRHRLSGRSTGRHGNQQPYPRASPEPARRPRPNPAQGAGFPSQQLHAFPPRSRPQTRVPPAP